MKPFWNLFAAQFAGAFNDNLFRTALVLTVTFRGASLGPLDASILVPLCGALFTAPFLLFSGLAGRLADRSSKTRIVRVLKLFEMGIVVVAGYGVLRPSLPAALSALFLLGVQAAFFGPAKYAVLPELLPSDRLVRGNAWVESGTFLAILLGTLVAGSLVPRAGGDVMLVTLLGLSVIFGTYAAWRLPVTPPVQPQLRLWRRPLGEARDNFRVLQAQPAVLHAVLGLSWFWLLGSLLLSVLPLFAHDHLHAGPTVVTMLFATVCIGMALGAMLCERLSRDRLELGLVPLGALGMCVALLDLAFASSVPRVGMDLLVLAVSAGVYTVPLYTIIQKRIAAEQRARAVAANNLSNAAFMMLGSLALVGFAAAGLGHSQIFLVLGLTHAAVSLYTYRQVPEFALRFVAWMMANVMYRITVSGREHVPRRGGAVLVCNHVSFVDFLIIGAVCKRPVRFVTYHKYHKGMPLLSRLFRDARIIPIAPAHEDAALLAAAFDQIANELSAGNVVCIFPEGKLTRDGHIGPFRTGIERIIKRTPAPVVPMALGGLWRSWFSRAPRKDGLLRHVRRRVHLTIGAPVDPAEVSASDLQLRVTALR